MANTYTFKTTFARQYQEQLFRQPVYRALVREAIAPKLKEGQTLSRSYLSRFAVGQLSATGGYSVQDFTSTAETLTVDQKPYGAFRIVEWQNFLDDLDTQEEAAAFCMNQLFNFTDSVVLGAIYAAAGTTLDAASFGGSAGSGISFNSGNAQQIFTLAQRQLILKNAFSGQFSAVKRFTGIKQADSGDRMPVAVIPAYLWSDLLLSLGGRWTPAGDRVTTNGFMDMLFSFNIFVSNNLTSTYTYDVSASNLSNGETITIGDLVLTGVTGSPASAGEFKIEAAANDTATNIKNFLNSPYTTISGKSIAFTQSSLSAETQTMLALLSATVSTSVVTIVAKGNSSVIVSTDSATGSFTKKICHAIFGTSQMADLAIVKDVMIGEPIPVSGSVAKDIVPRSLFGVKVFHDQSPRIVDVLLDISTFTTAPSY